MDEQEIAQAIAAERQRQDAKWGGPDHDDRHSSMDWFVLIEGYANLALRTGDMGEVVKVAALTRAAKESVLRMHRT